MLVTSCTSLGILWFVVHEPGLRRPGSTELRLAPAVATVAVFALVFALAIAVPHQALWALFLLAPATTLATRVGARPGTDQRLGGRPK